MLWAKTIESYRSTLVHRVITIFFEFYVKWLVVVIKISSYDHWKQEILLELIQTINHSWIATSLVESGPTTIILIPKKKKRRLQQVQLKKFKLTSVQMDFQYAIDIICGSINRVCNFRKLFKFIGEENSHPPTKLIMILSTSTCISTIECHDVRLRSVRSPRTYLWTEIYLYDRDHLLKIDEKVEINFYLGLWSKMLE
jgi:hypothetical protein